jgi:hypothetical protein
MTIMVRIRTLFIVINDLNLNSICFASLDISDGEMSHCSSFDANPNDVTVLPTKSAAMDKGKADTISETTISKRKRGNKQRAAALSNETCQTAPRKKQRVTKPKTTTQVAYTVDTVLTTWDA